MLVMPAGLLLLLGQVKPSQHTSTSASLPPPRLSAAALPLPVEDLPRPVLPGAGLPLPPAAGMVMSPVGVVSLRRSHSFATPSMSLLLIMVCSLRTNSSDVTLRRQFAALARPDHPLLLPCLPSCVLPALPGVLPLPFCSWVYCWPGLVAMSIRMTGPICMRFFGAHHWLGRRRSHSRMPPSREPAHTASVQSSQGALLLLLAYLLPTSLGPDLVYCRVRSPVGPRKAQTCSGTAVWTPRPVYSSLCDGWCAWVWLLDALPHQPALPPSVSLTTQPTTHSRVCPWVLLVCSPDANTSGCVLCGHTALTLPSWPEQYTRSLPTAVSHTPTCWSPDAVYSTESFCRPASMKASDAAHKFNPMCRQRHVLMSS